MEGLHKAGANVVCTQAFADPFAEISKPDSVMKLTVAMQDAVGDLGNRPLHLAVSQGCWLAVRFLLGHGALLVQAS